MNPRATCASDDSDSQQDQGSNDYPQLRRSQFDRAPSEPANQDEEAENVGKESHIKTSFPGAETWRWD